MNKIATERLKAERIKQNKTQKDVADFLGLTKQAVQRYEAGLSTPKLETWQKLADFFGVSVSYLQGLSRFRNSHESKDAWHSLRSSAANNHSSSLDKYNDEIDKQKDFYIDLFSKVENCYLTNQKPIKNLNEKQKKALAYLFDNVINQADQLAQLPSDRADLFISRSIDDSKEFKKAIHRDNDDDAYDYINDK
ncbi:helix-turn-helix domain-containing protein [Fructobacillus tropaeoli]|uniref:helix-turn-helix domain-containing protein n=1 Tax=Fructobacillus tropaeoli TaxID=709323 RepID=UPI001455E322|nr:helix-turn-helix transcriptional regulator [Fructobacillus tropaeoli]NLS38378.1 helix-turn-helix domain-containing protein [Fructobacillus tropaeoli]